MAGSLTRKPSADNGDYFEDLHTKTYLPTSLHKKMQMAAELEGKAIVDWLSRAVWNELHREEFAKWQER